MYGNTNQRRVDFVKERLIDISWGRKPDGDKYLDENGHKRPVPNMPGSGPLQQTGKRTLGRNWATEEPPPPPWALADEEAAAKDYPYDRRPAWLSAPPPEEAEVEQAEPQAMPGARGGRRAVPQREEDAYFVDKRMTTGGIHDAEMDDEMQERARKEWLQYHLQTSNWEAAEELVVTADEREDLAYLIERERRVAYEAGPAGPSTYDDPAHEDFAELNPAAEAAAKQGAPTPAHGSQVEDDDDDML